MDLGQKLKMIIFYIPSVLSSLEMSLVVTVLFLLAVTNATTFKNKNYLNEKFKLINLV